MPHGVIYLNVTAHGKPFITVSIDGQSLELLTLFLIGYFHFLMLMDLLTGQPLRWMAEYPCAQMCGWRSKKHPDITNDNSLGRSRGGYGTKIHMAADGSGIPLNIVLSAGQAHESLFALRLLDGIGVQRQNGSMKRRGHAVLADKAYSGNALRNKLKRKGIRAVIPRKSNEKLASDGRSQLYRDAYRRRNVVERCFGRLKEYRRIATRYEKTARNYLAMVKLGCIRLFYARLRN